MMIFLSGLFLLAADAVILVLLGRAFGFGWVLLLVAASSAAGLMLARREGLRVFRDWQAARSEGRVPGEGLFAGVLLLAAAALFVVPGPITDLLGLLLLLPPVRRAVSASVRRRIERGMASGNIRVTVGGKVITAESPPKLPKA